jgi:hypothetical protein
MTNHQAEIRGFDLSWSNAKDDKQHSFMGELSWSIASLFLNTVPPDPTVIEIPAMIDMY